MRTSSVIMPNIELVCRIRKIKHFETKEYPDENNRVRDKLIFDVDGQQLQTIFVFFRNELNVVCSRS